MNIPKLRFKEFTDEWQIKKLDKNTYIKARVGWKNLKASEYVSSGIPMIAGQHIKQGKILWDKVDFITNERYDESPEIQLKNNDIIFSKDGSLGNPAIIKNMPKKATINGTMMLIRLNYINDNVSPNYFYQICNSQYFKKMVSLIKSGRTVPHIFQRDIINFTFPIPKTLEEQEKIANFLSIVDKKVENLKNTITSLENQKKGLLQQIFSQKLRFKDKNGNNYPNWKEKLFSEIFSFLSTNSYSRAKMNEYHGTVKNIHYGDVLIKFNHIIDLSKHQLPYLINYNSIPKKILTEQLNKQLIKNGDIIIADTAEDYTAGKVCEVINVNDNLIVSGLHTMLCKPKPNLFSLGFLGYFMNSYTYHHQLLKLITGTKVYSIIKKEIIKTKILIPCLEEQTKIADFLSAFDRKLDNQKAQLEHWQQIKKGLLQQMFV